MDIEPIFALTPSDDQYKTLTAHYYPKFVETRKSDDLVSADLTTGIFFIYQPQAKYILKFQRIDIHEALHLFKTQLLDDLLFGLPATDDPTSDPEKAIYDETPRYLNARQRAKFSGVSVRTFKGWYSKGLPYYKISEEMTRIDKKDLTDFLDRFKMCKGEPVGKAGEIVEAQVSALVKTVTG